MGFVGAVGAVTIACFLLKLLRLTRSILHQARPVRHYGAWAMVTGATDGIGKAIAAELLKQGMKVILVARSQMKLDETVTELAAGKQGCVVGIRVDFEEFGGPTTSSYRHLAECFAEKEIGLLVNNVGISYDFPTYTHELDDARVASLLKLNVESVVYMTRMALPSMVERKRGAILNISSASGLLPSPLLAVYAASKSFIDKFSRDVSVEYTSKGVVVQSQAPLWIATKLASIRREKASWAVPLPETFARASLARIGADSSNCGYWVHDLAVFFLSAADMLGLQPLLELGALKMHAGLMKAGQNKREKAAASASKKD